jgi:hypothetical protein
MPEFARRWFMGRANCAFAVFAAPAPSLRIAGFEGIPIRR